MKREYFPRASVAADALIYSLAALIDHGAFGHWPRRSAADVRRPPRALPPPLLPHAAPPRAPRTQLTLPPSSPVPPHRLSQLFGAEADALIANTGVELTPPPPLEGDAAAIPSVVNLFCDETLEWEDENSVLVDNIVPPSGPTTPTLQEIAAEWPDDDDGAQMSHTLKTDMETFCNTYLSNAS